MEEATTRYHALLIGCDSYAPPTNSLSGCVNDIDAIEALLLTTDGTGLKSDCISITRLAAPGDGAASTSRYVAETKLPVKENILAALQQLAGEQVGPQDRVLIYYSGHGGQRLRGGEWHECLIATDGQSIDDDEMNALIVAIAQRTGDVTVVLDCCHSAGATRDIAGEPEHGATRMALLPEQAEETTDPLPAHVPLTRGTRMLQATDPDYIVVAACLADEKAQEDTLDGKTHGFLTYSLLQSVAALPVEQRADLRWMDIWPTLVHQLQRTASATERTAQHPWVIGHAARHIFGGPWKKVDPGFQITAHAGGSYTVQAGTLVGFTEGAMVGIYGRATEHFAPVDSEQDRQDRLGTLTVTSAGPSTCTAHALDLKTRTLPVGARVRLLVPGKSERLRVAVDPATPDPTPVLQQSSLLQIVTPELGLTPEVVVERTAQGWQISNALNPGLAHVRLMLPADHAAIEQAQDALRSGVEGYAPYNRVLRLAKTCNDPDLDQKIDVKILDCTDADALARVKATGTTKKPALPELGRTRNGTYTIPAGGSFCLNLMNMYYQTLYVSIFNCTAYGAVECIGEKSIKADTDVETFWHPNELGRPLRAKPDDPTRDTVDRFVIVATTKAGVDLRGLKRKNTIQQIIDAQLSAVAKGRGTDVDEAPVSKTERWTAQIVELIITV